jgi:hypothetical protein
MGDMTPKRLAELMKLSPSEREELVTTDRENYVDDDNVDDDWENCVDEDGSPEVRLEHETPEFFAELRRRSAEGRANPDSDISWADIERKLRAITGE